MNALQKFLDWWLGKTHWWRPRTCNSSCSICGHVYTLFRTESCFFYDEQNRHYSVCNECKIPDGKKRMYVSKFGHCVPVNEAAFKFELDRAGESGALYQKKVIEG